MTDLARECALRLIEDHERTRDTLSKVLEAVAVHRINTSRPSSEDIALWDSSRRLLPDGITDLKIRNTLTQPVPTNSSHG